MDLINLDESNTSMQCEALDMENTPMQREALDEKSNLNEPDTPMQCDALDSVSGNDEKIFTIVSSDQVKFENISYKTCKMSKLLTDIIGSCDDLRNNNLLDKIVSIPGVNSTILNKILEWMIYHVEQPPNKIMKPIKKTDLKDIVCDWDIQFIDVDNNTLFEIMNAANYMDIIDLLDLACAKLATMVKGKKPEEIREMLDIKNDFTPEQEEEIKEQVPF